MELGEALRIGPNYRKRTDAVSPPSKAPLFPQKGLWLFIRQHKNTDTNPCQTVLRASQNQAATLNCRKNLRQPCSCRPGMRAHAAKDGIRVFDVVILFYESAEFVPTFRGPGKWGRENQEPVYRDSWLPICQSCIPAGIFAIYMTDGNRILPWSSLISFSIHLYCISTSFLQPSLKIVS